MKTSIFEGRLLMALIVTFLPNLAIAQLRTPENVPITFYGKAVDQGGQPVTGAKVSFLLVTSHLYENRTSEKPMTLQTDGNGCFKLADVTGYAIGQIGIQKDGYELSQKATRGIRFGLIPDDYTPDPNNPVIFKMWKQAGKESLTDSSWRGRVTPDGATNRFDLLSGKKSAEGNLEIICKRNPPNSPPPGNARFDYTFEIRILGGAIQPTRDEFTFLAPDNGYSSNVIFSQKADDAKWDARMPKDFYIKTADSHYGILFVDWYAAQGSPSHLEWNCSINPSGSRNLER